MTAAVASFGANFLVWILDLIEAQVSVGGIAETLRFLSLYRRTEPFLMGQLSWAGIVYNLSFIIIFLALTVRHMDRQRKS